MKRLSLGCALLLAGMSASSAGAAAAPDSDEAEIIALDDAWIAAEVGHDKAALERIIDERFLATFGTGQTIGRKAFIDRILSTEIAPFTVRHDKIIIHGDTAVVIDVSQSGKTKFTWIAVRGDGEWRVISETFSHVDQPEAR